METKKIKDVFLYLRMMCKIAYTIKTPVYSLPIELDGKADLYDVIRHYRIKRGYTIKELSSKVNVSKDTIMTIESDKNYYGVKVIKKIIKELDIEDIGLEKMDGYMKFLYLGGQAQIKEIRKRLKLTQVGFAELLGCSRSSVRDWEIGKTELSKMSWKKVMDIWKKVMDICKKYDIFTQ